MKAGDLVEWKGSDTTATWDDTIYKAGGIGVVIDTMPHPDHRWNKKYCRVLFPAPAGELVLRPCTLKVLS